MKFKELAIGNYFSFVRKNDDSAVVLQKFAENKFRYANGSGITVYSKNETVEDLGEEYERPVLTQFNKLGVGHYFIFHECRTVYQKVSKYHIRRFSETKSIYYNRNGETQDLGQDFAEFIEPIHVRVRKRS